MSGTGRHALVFGASGLVGWAIVDQLLSDYPARRTFSRVTALVNRPFDIEESFWPDGPTARQSLQLVSGVNLVEGTAESVRALLSDKITDIADVTHIFYFAYKSESEPTEEVRVMCKMLECVIDALQPLVPNLEFVVFPSGTKSYGIQIPGGYFEPPYTEEMGPLPNDAEDAINYPPMREMLKNASANAKWTWCDICPDAVIGFVPNGSAFNLTAHWATYLSLYALVEGHGSKVPFPGSTNGYNSLYNEASSEIIAKCSIWAALHPSQSAGQTFNIADQASPESMKERWPALAAYFGLEGTGPSEDESVLKPSWYIAKHRGAFEKVGIKSSPVFKGDFLDSYGYYLDFDRQMSLAKLRAEGFTEELDPNRSWFKAFEHYKEAGMIPS